jgi:hypothetical protein
MQSVHELHAGVVMGLTCFPLSILSIFLSYWHASSDVASSSLTLWKVSTTFQMNGDTVEQENDMCSSMLRTTKDPETQEFDDCTKIEVLRFITISAALMSLISSMMIIGGFSQMFSFDRAVQRNVSRIGLILASAVFVWALIGLCIAASVDFSNASLNGAGFMCLVGELLTLLLASAILSNAIIRRPTDSQTSTGNEQHDIPKTTEAIPNLLNSSKKATIDKKHVQDIDIERVVIGANGDSIDAKGTTAAPHQAGPIFGKARRQGHEDGHSRYENNEAAADNEHKPGHQEKLSIQQESKGQQTVKEVAPRSQSRASNHKDIHSRYDDCYA